MKCRSAMPRRGSQRSASAAAWASPCVSSAGESIPLLGGRMIALLAPVPAVHLPDAFKVQNAEGIVAFGTGAKSEVNSGEWSFQFFSKEEFSEGKGILPVLI